MQTLITIKETIKMVTDYAAHHLPGLSLPSFRYRTFVRQLWSPDDARKNKLY
jgi:hypothetical protein